MPVFTSVKYSHEPGICAWPIPFPFTNAAQVGVRLQDETGVERQLVFQSDYFIQDKNVVYVLPAGYQLIIYLDAPLAEVMAANNQAVAASAASAITEASLANEAATELPATNTEPDAASLAAIADLETRIAELEEEKAQALIAARAAEADTQIKTIRETANSGTEQIEANTESAISAIQKEAAIAAEAIEQARSSLLAAESKARTAIDESGQAKAEVQAVTEDAIASLETKAGELEAMLLTAGSTQKAGISALAKTAVNEAANGIDASADSASRAASDAGQYVQEAAGYAQKSGTYAAQAQASAFNAQLAVSDCQALKAGAEKAALKSQFWKEQAEAVARTAVNTANQVNQAHWQISNIIPNGGIRCVNNEAELEFANAGSYIINPFITQTPTPAYGVWPVDDLDKCNWDGFFILGPEFDGLAPSGPPETQMPEEPGDDPTEPENGNGAANREWLPCHHTHQEAAYA